MPISSSAGDDAVAAEEPGRRDARLPPGAGHQQQRPRGLAEARDRRARPLRDRQPRNAYDLAVLGDQRGDERLPPLRDARRARSAPERAGLWRSSAARCGASRSRPTARPSRSIDDAELQARLDQVVAEHGFRIVSNDVDAEAATPAHLRRVLRSAAAGRPISRSYVVVEGAPQVAVETEQSQICVTGVEHGQRYNIELRAGLPSADGETLRNDVELNRLRARPRAVRRLCQQRLRAARRPRRRPADHLGQRRDGRHRDLPHRRPLDRDRRPQRHLPAHARRLFGRGRRQHLWREGLGRPGRPRRRASATPCRPPRFRSARSSPTSSPAPMSSPPRSPTSNQDYWSELATQWFIVTDLGAHHGRGRRRRPRLRPLAVHGPAGRRRHRPPGRRQQRNPRRSRRPTPTAAPTSPRASPAATAAARRSCSSSRRRPATTPSSMSPSPPST